MKQFKFSFGHRYGDNEKDCDVLIIEALSEASAKQQLKIIVPGAYDINLLK